MSQLQKTQQKSLPPSTSMQMAASALLCSLICITSAAFADSTTRIVKWKDEKGVTHYGDKIPPQYANRENSLINKQGITVQQNKPEAPQDKAAELAKLQQEKKDHALLGTFTNANEIDLTRDRNLEPDLLALKNLEQDRAAAQKKLDKINAVAEGYAKSKKTLPANVLDEIKTNKTELAKIDQRINDRQQAIDSISKRFEEDKKRYQLLKSQANNPQKSTPPTKTDAAGGKHK